MEWRRVVSKQTTEELYWTGTEKKFLQETEESSSLVEWAHAFQRKTATLYNYISIALFNIEF